MPDSFTLAIGIALLGGMLSFLSPCVLPLVPGYLCFAAGMEFEELSNATPTDIRTRVLPSSLSFVAGFSVVFISLGAGAAAINPFILAYKDVLSQIAGVFIVLLGLHLAGVFRVGFVQNILQKEWRFSRPVKTSHNWRLLTAFGLGLAFAFGWTPCIGPILATILTMAAASDSLNQGVMLLSAYAAGLGIPFILASLGVSYFLRTGTKLKPHFAILEKATGGLLVLTGVLIYFGSLQNIAGVMLDWFPALITLG